MVPGTHQVGKKNNNIKQTQNVKVREMAVLDRGGLRIQLEGLFKLHYSSWLSISHSINLSPVFWSKGFLGQQDPSEFKHIGGTFGKSQEPVMVHRTLELQQLQITSLCRSTFSSSIPMNTTFPCFQDLEDYNDSLISQSQIPLLLQTLLSDSQFAFTCIPLLSDQFSPWHSCLLLQFSCFIFVLFCFCTL